MSKPYQTPNNRKIEPRDLRVECEQCGGYRKRLHLKGELSIWNGTGCTECMGSGQRLPHKVDL